MDIAMAGARRRLARPECQALFTDFVDRAGHTLAAVLGESGRTAAEYLGDLYFVEGNTSAQCRRRPTLVAYTSANGRVVYLCKRFMAYFSEKTSAGEILLIHELLHALGLGENPPTSDDITARVWARCGDRPGRDD